jgi:hypothetical protein
MHPTALLWLVWEMRGVESDCADSTKSQKLSASTEGLSTGLELVEDFQGATFLIKIETGWKYMD